MEHWSLQQGATFTTSPLPLTISLSQPPTPGLLSIFLCFKLVSDLFLLLDAFLLQIPKRQRMQTLIAFQASLLIASITNRAKEMQSQESQFFDIWDNFQVYGSTLCEHWTFSALHISNLLKAASSWKVWSFPFYPLSLAPKQELLSLLFPIMLESESPVYLFVVTSHSVLATWLDWLHERLLENDGIDHLRAISWRHFLIMTLMTAVSWRKKTTRTQT